MKKIIPKTLSGFMELLPAPQIAFDAMAARLRETFSLYGFTPIDTPLIEYAEVLLAKGGGETEKQIYRFMRGEHDLALRFDLTVPLAKYVAQNYARLAFPFRRYQIGKVYRGERAQRGRFREFYQADIDIIGDASLGLVNDAEIPSVIYGAFASLGLKNFVIRLNNRKILNGFFALLGLSDKASDIMRTIDKLDKIGADGTRGLLTDECGLDASRAEEILSFVSNAEDLSSAADRYAGRDETFDLGVRELREVMRLLRDFGVPETHRRVDLSIARGLEYYTGTVYETTLTGRPEIGSVCSGGRYDNLAEYYTDKKLPGVGISIGLTRLFYVLEEQGYLNGDFPVAPCDVLLLSITEDFSRAAALATALRAEGLRVRLYGEDKKFKAKMSYADKIGVPYVVFLGDDEIKAGKITVKDMRTGEQAMLAPETFARDLTARLAAERVSPVREPEA
jgi:histidyl-tRNA synthetase